MKSAKTMQDLLTKTKYRLQSLKKANFIKGRITEIKKKMVFVDVGAKTEGMIVGKDFEEVKDYIKQLKLGDEVLCYIKQPENEHGQIILSFRKAANDWKWQFFEEKLSTSESFKVRAQEINKGGIIVHRQGIQGFVPSSQFAQKYQDNLDQLLNKIFKVKVIEVDRENNRLIFSEKAVSEAKLIARKKKLLKKVKIGDELEGRVAAITPFGLFVKVSLSAGELEGLVHISEISWEKVEKPDDFFKIKQKVKIKVIGIDDKTGRLNLSIKQLVPDPWEKIDKKYSVGKKLKGKVATLAPFGAFVNFEPGVEGLLHISKIPVDINIDIGKEIEVEVESLDPKTRRMSLSLILRKKPVGYK